MLIWRTFKLSFLTLLITRKAQQLSLSRYQGKHFQLFVNFRNHLKYCSTPREDTTKKTKKHKKRKGKLPKNYDASAQPDPERWLPRYERTGYRKKRDRRVKEVMKGSQGTAFGQAEQ